MKGTQFYTSNNKEKYAPDGKLHQCKKCITLHVDAWNYDTYAWILQELDVPYVPKEWDAVLARWGQDPSKVTGLTILGRYLSKMKLTQYKDYRWKDGDFIQKLKNKEIADALKQQGADQATIQEAIEESQTRLEPSPEVLAAKNAPEVETPPQFSATLASPFAEAVEAELVQGLTDEDQRYLCLQWGKNYRPDEWVRLEQLYTDMMQSYDIQTAGDKNTLILACKASLKANQLMDVGDIEGAQKATKMYDSLMKAGKWTAAQNKNEDDYIDSIGELVSICEAEGFIPKYYTDGPQDKIDRVIQDMQKYTEDLIRNESGLSIMIENAVKQIKEEAERIEHAAADSQPEELEEDKMFNYDETPVLTVQDYMDFSDFEQELEEEDAEVI